MNSTKITRQRNGRMVTFMVGTTTTRQRMENEMVGTKSHPRDGRHKNNSPNADGRIDSKMKFHTLPPPENELVRP